MRIKIEFETEGTFLPIDYRRKFLSYLKGTLQDYNQDLFESLYNEGNSPKSFCSSIYFLPEVIIAKEEIMLKSKRFIARFTTPDVLMGVHLINAFMARRNKWMPLADCNNRIKALSIAKEKEHSISSNVMKFKILSPIVVRDHDEKTGKDWYFTFEDEAFEEVWKRNLKTELKSTFGRDVSRDIDALKVKPIHLKKTVVKNYNIAIPTTLGSMMLEGEPYLLDYLYKAGIGSKRALFFGYIELI